MKPTNHKEYLDRALKQGKTDLYNRLVLADKLKAFGAWSVDHPLYVESVTFVGRLPGSANLIFTVYGDGWISSSQKTRKSSIQKAVKKIMSEI